MRPNTQMDEPVPPMKVKEPSVSVPKEVKKTTAPTPVAQPETPAEENMSFVEQAESIVEALKRGQIASRAEYTSDPSDKGLRIQGLFQIFLQGMG